MKHVIKGIIVHTSAIYPPIPLRQLDWQAVTDNYDCDYDDEYGYTSQDPIGHGETEEAAIADLIEQIEEDT